MRQIRSISLLINFTFWLLVAVLLFKFKFIFKSPESSSLSWFISILYAGLRLGGVSDSRLLDASASSLSVNITKKKKPWMSSDEQTEEVTTWYCLMETVIQPMLIKPFNLSLIAVLEIVSRRRPVLIVFLHLIIHHCGWNFFLQVCRYNDTLRWV